MNKLILISLLLLGGCGHRNENYVEPRWTGAVAAPSQAPSFPYAMYWANEWRQYVPQQTAPIYQPPRQPLNCSNTGYTIVCF